MKPVGQVLSYVKTVFLKSKKIVNVNARLMKAFSGSKVEVSRHFVHLQEPIDITPLTFFILHSL